MRRKLAQQPDFGRANLAGIEGPGAGLGEQCEATLANHGITGSAQLRETLDRLWRNTRWQERAQLCLSASEGSILCNRPGCLIEKRRRLGTALLSELGI